jgi:bacterioferritin
MKGDPEILDMLNDVLTGELTAINQYFVHAKMCENWGYTKLHEKMRAEAIEEMHDADKVIDRILFLDGVPNMQRLGPVRVGEDVVEQHKSDMKLEVAAIERLNKGIAVCRERGDNGTRELLEGILKGEESHLDWLEARLHIVGDIGKERYLAEQI